MKNKKIIIAICVLAAFLCGTASYSFYFKPAHEFKLAVETYNSNDYDKAILQFKKLNGYKNSEEYLKKCNDNIKDYNKAVTYYDSNEYKKSYSLFKKVGNYKKSKEYLKKCSVGINKDNKYSKAVKDLTDCEFDSAIKSFEQLGDFKDSKQKLKESKKKKESWGKIKKFKFDYYYTEINDVPQYEVITPDGVRKETGYECRAEIIIDESDEAVVSSTVKKFKSKTFYSSFIDGYAVTMYFRAYKELKTGNTIYGEWKKAVNDSEIKLLKADDWKKKSKNYASLDSCIEELDFKKADELFAKYNNYDEDFSEDSDFEDNSVNKSVTSYKNADDLSFTASSPAVNEKNYSLYGVGNKFSGDVSQIAIIYKIRSKKHKKFYFDVNSTNGKANYTAKPKYNNHYACGYLWFPNSGTYYVDVYDDDTGDLLASSKFVID